MSVSFQPDGHGLSPYCLRGSGGLMVEFIPFGGIVTRMLAPDREGRLEDVVLGFPDLALYRGTHPYFGAIAGRVAGRITGASFSLEGKIHPLSANDPPNHLHGGRCGFDRQLWDVTPIPRADGAPSFSLSYLSPDGEEGYPGNVRARVTYTVTAENTFVIEAEASTDRATPFGLTHHSYFNLGGERAENIADHVLQIDADHYAPTDDSMTLLGRREPVIPANDFRAPRALGQVIPGLHGGHGDLYFLQPPVGAMRQAARVCHPSSGRILSVFTTESCLQLYTGVSLDGSLVGKSGRSYGRHAGLCLECEGYPDAANRPALDPSAILHPGQLHRRATHYKFSTAR